MTDSRAPDMAKLAEVLISVAATEKRRRGRPPAHPRADVMFVKIACGGSLDGSHRTQVNFMYKHQALSLLNTRQDSAAVRRLWEPIGAMAGTFRVPTGVLVELGRMLAAGWAEEDVLAWVEHVDGWPSKAAQKALREARLQVQDMAACVAVADVPEPR